MQDVAQRVARHRPNDGVNMIGHYDPGTEFVSLARKKLQSIRHHFRNRRLVQPARAVSGVKQRFDLVTIPSEQLFFFVPRQRAFGRAGLFENDFAFVFEPGDFVGGQESASRKVTK